MTKLNKVKMQEFSKKKNLKDSINAYLLKNQAH